MLVKFSSTKHFIMKRLFFFFIAFLSFFSIINAQTHNWEMYDILHYEINLSITDISSKTINGNTLITSTLQVENADSMYLFLEKLNVDSILFNEKHSVEFIHDNDSILKISFPETIEMGDTFTVRIYYGGQPAQDPEGFGGFLFSSDNNYAYNLGVGMNVEPHTYGRAWFPCLDTFTSKSSYDLYITTKSPQIAICGGILISQTENPETEFITSHWKISQKIPTYLVSVAVSDYVLVSDTVELSSKSIPIDIYVRSSEEKYVEATFTNLKKIIIAYEENFGTYQWDRVGYVGVPFMYGAMEHAMNIAYPRILINGTLIYESVIAHELGHSWFGNLVTCASAEDMWINEGWAVFSEYVYREAVYGEEEGKNYVRDKHKGVLHNAHIADDGYKALYPMKKGYIYGTTTYEKGAIVTQMLRHYIGNDLFFETVRQYLKDYEFKNISTPELQAYLTTKTGIDLKPFFDAWVYRPGFSTFIVDSFKVSNNDINKYFVDVYFTQKLKGTTDYATHNKFEVLFIGENGIEKLDTVQFADIHSHEQFELEFEPKSILIDPNYKTAFATTKRQINIKSKGNITLDDVLCRLEVEKVKSDSAQIIIQHHWIAPENDKIDEGTQVFRMSDYRYWEIDGNNLENAKINCRFQYNKTTGTSGNLDNNLLPHTQSADSLILLYRPNSSEPWKLTTFTKTGAAVSGYLSTTNIRPGQYAFGIGLPNLSNIEKEEEKQQSFNIYPNPSNDKFVIDINPDIKVSHINITDYQGKQVAQINVTEGQKQVIWAPINISYGTYIMQLIDKDNPSIKESKAVIFIGKE